jgi:hypothetical protein
VADDLGVRSATAWPPTLLPVVPGALLLALLVAWPASRAATRPTADALRAE